MLTDVKTSFCINIHFCLKFCINIQNGVLRFVLLTPYLYYILWSHLLVAYPFDTPSVNKKTKEEDICHIVSQYDNMVVSLLAVAIGWHSICMIRGEQRSEMNININRK